MDGFDLQKVVKDAEWASPSHPPPRKAILVLGMSRSGTSLLTSILHNLGAALPRELIGPARGNMRGHWEPRALVSLNDEILRRLGRRWDDPRPLPTNWFRSPEVNEGFERIVTEIEKGYADAPLLVIKDPRICRLLPLYTEALNVLNIVPLVVLQVRPMAEVAQSLADRDDLRFILSELLWLRSITESEWHSRNCSRVWVSFGQVIADWRDSVDRIGDGLNVKWPTPPSAAAERVASLLKPGPDRSFSMGRGMELVKGLTGRAWDAVQAGLAADEPAARAGFDEVRTLLQDTDRLHAAALSHLVGRREAELRAMRASTCWTLTAPLRALKRWSIGEAAEPVDPQARRSRTGR